MRDIEIYKLAQIVPYNEYVFRELLRLLSWLDSEDAFKYVTDIKSDEDGICVWFSGELSVVIKKQFLSNLVDYEVRGWFRAGRQTIRATTLSNFEGVVDWLRRTVFIEEWRDTDLFADVPKV